MSATKSAAPSKSRGPQLMPRIPSDNKPITDLSSFSAPELVELRDRQMHLLDNKKRLQSLPDKGERIRSLYQRIVSELLNRDAITDAAQLFSALNIAATGKSLTAQMEWAGRTISAEAAAADAEADAQIGLEDCDERDPIRLLAQSRQTVKQVTIAAPVESLITAADRADIEELQREASLKETSAESVVTSDKDAPPPPEPLEPHALYMCSIDGRHPIRKDRFLPHKTVIPHLEQQNAEGAAGKPAKPTGKIAHLWENTAATPPALRNAELVALSLQDSIDIQRKQQDLLKQLDLQHAAERLVAREKLTAKLRLETASETATTTPSASNLSGSMFGTYRSTANSANSDVDSDDEQVDEVASDDEEYGDDHDEPRGGGVTVESYD